MDPPVDASADTGERPELSVVAPLYNEEGNVGSLVTALQETLAPLGISYEILLVDDGSRDGTWRLIREASASDSHIKGISFSRNFGHQNALYAGMHYATGQAVVTMDGDLQHPPATIPQLIQSWREGHKVVETQRIDSDDTSFFKRLTSRWFYGIFSLLSGLPLARGTSDFRLLDRQVVENLKNMKDSDLFLRGLSHWVGYRKTTIPYHAAPRHAGRTKYSLFRMIRFATSSLLSFSVVPLRLGIYLGLFTSVLAFAELVYIFVRYLQGNAVPGWASILTVISFMFGILFILIGILGAYLGSIFETLKNRPRFLVNETAGFRDA